MGFSPRTAPACRRMSLTPLTYAIGLGLASIQRDEFRAAPATGRPRRAGKLPFVVRELWRSHATGTLQLHSAATSKRLFFEGGDIVFAGTNVEHERLGERLVSAGRIKRSVLDLSLRVMERSNERFGTTIVELGWVSAAEMQRYVAAQIKEIIYSVFTWNDGDYHFAPGVRPVPRDIALQLMTAELIYEGASRIGDSRAIRAGIGSWEQSVTLHSGGRLNIPVTQQDGYVLSRIGERATIARIVEASPLSEDETLRRVYALALAGRRGRPGQRRGADHAARARRRLLPYPTRSSCFATPLRRGARPSSSRTSTIDSVSIAGRHQTRSGKPTRR